MNQDERKNRGVLYLGHLPEGFNEGEVREFFSQFGEVTRFRIARSKKTARSKGYGFVEFSEKETAEATAKALDNRPMMNKSLKCHVVPEEKVHHELFKNCDRGFRYKPNAYLNSKDINTEKDDESKARKV